MNEHRPETYYWNADSAECPHGDEPAFESVAWNTWIDDHQASDDGFICLSAPVGQGCVACSEEDGEMVPWASCRARQRIEADR